MNSPNTATPANASSSLLDQIIQGATTAYVAKYQAQAATAVQNAPAVQQTGLNTPMYNSQTGAGLAQQAFGTASMAVSSTAGKVGLLVAGVLAVILVVRLVRK